MIADQATGVWNVTIFYIVGRIMGVDRASDFRVDGVYFMFFGKGSF